MTADLTAPTATTDVPDAGRTGEVPPPGRGAAAVERLRRAPEWLVCLGVGLLVAVLAVLPYWRGRVYYSYWVGDQYAQYAPLWHLIGRGLREGQWLPMDPAGWMGGNYAGEGLTGIWNPVNLLNSWLTSFLGDLSLAALVVMVEVLALLGMATFLLAREYGAGRVPAVLVATALPLGGFPLWYQAAGWSQALWAFTWVAFFWWSAHRFARGRLTPFVPFLFGCLGMTTGEPYGALGLVAVLAILAVELLLQRRFGRLAHLVVMGACVGLVALLVYLPLVSVTPVSTRQQLQGLTNDTWFVPDLGDVAAASSPTYLPTVQYWGGPFQPVPAVYLAWFVVPLLPWLRWGELRRRSSGLAGVYVMAGGYLLAALAPSAVWLFRWPLRVIEYSYLAVAVLFAVALSAGLARDHRRRRALATGALVLVETYFAWAVHPTGMNRIHAVGFLLFAGLTALALAGGLRRGLAALGAVGVVGTALIVAFQTSVFPVVGPGETVTYPAHDLSRIAAGAAGFRGDVFQVASMAGVTTDQLRDGEFVFGNQGLAAGVPTLTSYTGIGFKAFADTLCVNYRGETCPQAFDRLWAPAGDGVDVPLVDALRVSTVVIQRSLRPDAADRQPPPGWRVAQHDPVRTVWVRETPIAGDGRVSWASPGVSVLRDASSALREEVRYRSDGAGRVLLTRLNWPGYSAQVDGRAVPLATGPAGMVSLDVPAGSHTVALTYAAPGSRLGSAAAILAVVLALVQAVVWSVQRRRRRTPEGVPAGR